MKKSLLVIGALAVLALAAVLAVPFWLGTKIEEVFHDRLAKLASNNGLIVASEQFERGWLFSKARAMVRAPGLPVEFSAEHVIAHGPFRLDRWLAGDFALEPLRAHIETRGTLKVSMQVPISLPISIDTTIAFNGEGHAHVESPPHARAKDDDVEWAGLKGDVHFDAALQRIRADLHVPRLAYGPAEVVDMKLASNVREEIAGHYVGKMSFHIGSLSFGPMLRAKKLGIVTETQVQESNLTVALSYDVLDVQTPNGQFGPGKLRIDARKLDAAILTKFQQEMNALQKSGRPQEQIGLMRVGKLMQLVGELAKKSPELEITELRFRMGDEEISGRAKLVLDGSKSDLTQNPLLILTAVAGDAELLLPPALLKPMLLPLLMADLEDYRRRGLLGAQPMTPEQTAAILDQSLPLYLARHDFTRRLIQDSGRYRLSASLRRGQILVNGEPLSLPGAGVLPQRR